MVEKFETGTSQVLAELELGVLKVTLNRPEARNALSEELTPALREMVAACSSDDRIRCLLLTGAGKAFCAGGDIKSMGRRLGGEKTAEEKIATLLEGQRTLSGAIHELPIPTLAALPGPAAGAGLGIALACDRRIAGTSAFMATGYVRIGLSGDYGATYFMHESCSFQVNEFPLNNVNRWGLLTASFPMRVFRTRRWRGPQLSRRDRPEQWNE